MAEEQAGLRNDVLRDWAPWTKLFSAFKVALDPKKMLLAAAGILAVALGWWLLAAAAWQLAGAKPEWKTYRAEAGQDKEKLDAAYKAFMVDRQSWNKLFEMAGPLPEDLKKREFVDVGDLAKTPVEYDALDEWKSKSAAEIRDAVNAAKLDPRIAGFALQLQDPAAKPSSKLRILPWFEDRGPNQYLLITGRAGVPWEHGRPLHWALVLIEPLVKFFSPVIYLFDSGINLVNRLYLILVILWTLVVWAIFGGAITRMASVQLARPTNDRLSLTDALKFSYLRFKSYFSAPVIPLVFLFILTAVLFVFGLLEVYTGWAGDVLGGLLWPVVLLIGLIMAVVVVGLVGWPLMYATISAEGSDSFDAISRSYSYVYQAPWQYLWYTFVAVLYGAVLVFFVGLMGSLTVYLGKWGVNQVPQIKEREQSYLYMYAPTSFGWRNLLLVDSPNVSPGPVVLPSGAVGEELRIDPKYLETVNVPNRIGAFLVSAWLYLVFLLVIGFGYSYFWTASTIIYFLMRRVVDDTEMDEVHLEEDDHEEPPFPPPPTTGITKPASGGGVMVDAPTMRPTSSEAKISPGPETPVSESPSAAQTDGSPPGTMSGGEEKKL